MLPLGLPQFHILSIILRIVMFCIISAIEKFISNTFNLILGIRSLNHVLQVLSHRWLDIKEIICIFRLLWRIVHGIHIWRLIGFWKSRCIAALVLAVHNLHEIVAEKRRFQRRILLTTQILDMFSNFIVYGLAQASEVVFLIVMHNSVVLLLTRHFWT